MNLLKVRSEDEVKKFYSQYENEEISCEDFVFLCDHTKELEFVIGSLIYEHNHVMELLKNDLDKYVKEN